MLDRRTHVKQLAGDLGVTLREGPEWLDSPIFDECPMFLLRLTLSNSSAYCCDSREVFVHNLDRDTAYWSALHELGHAALGHSGEDTFNDVVTQRLLDVEVQAWEWAVAHSRTPLTPDAVGRISDKLGSYVKNVGAGVDTTEAVALLTRLGRATRLI